MKCPDNGFLQAYIDGELEIDERKALEEHFSRCEKCSDALELLKSNDDFAFIKIKAYRDNIYERINTINDINTKNDIKNNFDNSINTISDIFVKAPENKQIQNKNKGVYKIMLKYKKFTAIACSAVLLTTCFAFQPVRAAISNSLLIFRANDVKSINITQKDIMDIQNQLLNNKSVIDLKNMGKIKTIGGGQKNISIEEAKTYKDINVAFPQQPNLGNPEITVNNPYTMEFTLNTASINKLMKSLGAKTLLPDSLDGKTFEVDLPSGVTLSYPKISNGYFKLFQSKIPEIKAPEGVNPDDIYNALVSLPVIPENIKKQLVNAKDWNSTLYIPVIDSKSQEIKINGAKGYIMEPSPSIREIIWYNNGVIYSMSSTFDKDELIKIANSVR